MVAIGLVCPKLNSLILWGQKGSIHLYFHHPKAHWFTASSATGAAFLPFSGVGWPMHCGRQLHWRSNLPVDTWRWWIRSWFCTSSRLGQCKCLKAKNLFKIMDLRWLCWREIGKRLCPLKHSPFLFVLVGGELSCCPLLWAPGKATV